VNCGNVTAIFRRIHGAALGAVIGRGGSCAQGAQPKAANEKRVLVASSAMPAFMMLLFTGAVHALQMTARMLERDQWAISGLGCAREIHTMSSRRERWARAERLG